MRVAAIDQGTTSTRCLVVEDGGIAKLAGSLRHEQRYPAPGWVEQDPEELIANIRAVLESAGPVDAIAIANQGESCLAWDAVTGAPLSPVIVWQDTRTSAALAGLGPAAEARSKQISGLPLDAYFSASKLAWAVAHAPGAAQALAEGRLRLGTTDSFFLDRLCGSFLTDVATASRTGLMDLERQAWSAELCQLYGVPMSCLPAIVAVDAGFGTIGGAPVTVSIVDQQAALYGHGCREVGDCKITFGTGGFLLAVAAHQPSPDSGLLPTVGWRKEGEATAFAVEGGVYDAGAALEWAMKLGLFQSMDELSDFEGPSALSRGIVFVPALSGLAAPYWDRTAAPLFIGMDHATGRRDLVRAILEGVAMLTVGLIEAAARTTGSTPSISIDGGLSQSEDFARFLAAAADRPVRIPPMHELTAIGLAEFCGVDVAAARAPARTYLPDGSVDEICRARFAEAVARARNWRR